MQARLPTRGTEGSIKKRCEGRNKRHQRRERRPHLWPWTSWSCNTLFRVSFFKKGGGRVGTSCSHLPFGKQCLSPDIPVFKFQPLADKLLAIFNHLLSKISSLYNHLLTVSNILVLGYVTTPRLCRQTEHHRYVHTTAYSTQIVHRSTVEPL